MPNSAADDTADFLDAQYRNLEAYTPGLVTPADAPGNVTHVEVTVPAWLVLRLWEGLRTAARQLRTVAAQYRAAQQRGDQLAQRAVSQAAELDRLRGTESMRLEHLTRWASAFAQDNGLDVDALHEAVREQAAHDHALWSRLDRERGELEQFRHAVRSCVDQTREAGAEANGLDARGVQVVLRALDRAYRTSRR